MSITIDEMAVFCKREGFVYPNSELYGGFAGFYDYGPLGVEVKNNIKNEFWKAFVQQREDVVGIDGTIITHPDVWKASGHVDSFTDAVFICRKCKTQAKADASERDAKCPKCGSAMQKGNAINLMFQTNVGPTDSGTASFLRPETAQLIFTNFKLVQDNARKKLPFGIAQTGKAFRNEISPRDFLFRTREFEQMEIEYFVHPDRINDCGFFKTVEKMKLNVLTAEMQKSKKQHSAMALGQLVEKKLASGWQAYWLGMVHQWFLDLGIKSENLRVREHLKDELAHYATACFDIEYNFPFGWKEIHGNADRKQFDLQQHMKLSGKDLSYYDEESKQKIVPYVASEPSQGVDRAFLAFMFDAYDYDEKRGTVVLKLHPKLAPVKAAVLPLVNKLDKEARSVFDGLKEEFNCAYERSGSVGRRYARNDEMGTPFCVTVDFDTAKDKSATIRNRDDAKQIRVPIAELKNVLDSLIKGTVRFEKAGKPVKS